LSSDGFVDDEVAELEAAGKVAKPPKPKGRPCKFCKALITWREDEDTGVMLPYNLDGERHRCKEYFDAKKRDEDFEYLAKRLHHVLHQLYPSVDDELPL